MRASATLFAAVVAACSPGESRVPELAEATPPEATEVDLSHHFEAFGATGTFVLHDAATGRRTVHNPAASTERALPASTFKILNSLIALEEGVISDQHEIIPWDGVDRGEWWNGDQAMTRAFQRSSVWFYQELARRIGRERMDAWVQQVGYGSADTGGELDRFWLDGPLTISAMEQLDFLRRVHAGKLPFSSRNLDIVREIMLFEGGDGYVIRGKTGWTRHDGGHTAWLVGWVEQGSDVRFFVTRIAAPPGEFAAQDAQRAITRGALRELGALPPAP